MNKRKLNKVFKLAKTELKLDYAITNADEYGDCNTCVNSELCFEFGTDSKGIYTKHWTRGMNAGGPWKDLNDVYIGHDITPEQGEILIRLFDENGYNVEPKKYDPSKSFMISEKEELR